MEHSVGKPFLTGTEFLSLPQKKRKWLIEPLIPVGGIVNLYGKPKTGKSFASFGMALAIANGLLDWNGFPVRTHGPVMTLQIDTPEGEMYDRILAVQSAGYDVSNLYFADMDIAPYPYNIMLPQHQTWLRNEVKRIQPWLVIIDTLREAHELNENDSTDMKKVINALVKICRPEGIPPAAVALISHSRKDSVYNAMGADQDMMDEGRGSSYVSGRMDTVLRFTGNPSKKKGHMHYKGRSKGADGKIPIVQDPDTGLVVVDGQHAKSEQIVMQVLREHGHDWSKHKMAKEIVTLGGAGSISTAERWIEKIKPLMDSSQTKSDAA